MTDAKKRRTAMLDGLTSAPGAAAPPPAPPASQLGGASGALRSARDAVDGHHVWDLDPAMVDDLRLADRLAPEDVLDLRDAIETNGQAVPILVRRNPEKPDRYLLIYGRRRLEAIRQSDRVDTVRALVATLDDQAALQAQISENMARRDLTFIEKALFAQELIASGFGTQSRVAEVLTVTKSSVSMALSVAEAVGPDLARAIGPAQGIGRPRWETLARDIQTSGADLERLVDIARGVYDRLGSAAFRGQTTADDPSVLAFEAVAQAVAQANELANELAPKPAAPAPRKSRAQPLRLSPELGGRVTRTPKGLRIEIDDSAFAAWLEAEAQPVLTELHARWLSGREET